MNGKSRLKKFFLVVVCLLIIYVLGTVLLIQHYLKVYHMGDTTVWDVVEVNIGIRDIIKWTPEKQDPGGETEYYLASSDWFGHCEDSPLLRGYQYYDQMGNGKFFRDENGDSIVVCGQDEWCHYFRVYSVTR